MPKQDFNAWDKESFFAGFSFAMDVYGAMGKINAKNNDELRAYLYEVMMGTQTMKDSLAEGILEIEKLAENMPEEMRQDFVERQKKRVEKVAARNKAAGSDQYDKDAAKFVLSFWDIDENTNPEYI